MRWRVVRNWCVMDALTVLLVDMAAVIYDCWWGLSAVWSRDLSSYFSGSFGICD